MSLLNGVQTTFLHLRLVCFILGNFGFLFFVKKVNIPIGTASIETGHDSSGE